MTKLLFILNFIAFVVSVVWWYRMRDFEPAIASLTLAATLLGFIIKFRSIQYKSEDNSNTEEAIKEKPILEEGQKLSTSDEKKETQTSDGAITHILTELEREPFGYVFIIAPILAYIVIMIYFDMKTDFGWWTELFLGIPGLILLFLLSFISFKLGFIVDSYFGGKRYEQYQTKLKNHMDECHGLFMRYSDKMIHQNISGLGKKYFTNSLDTTISNKIKSFYKDLKFPIGIRRSPEEIDDILNIYNTAIDNIDVKDQETATLIKTYYIKMQDEHMNAYIQLTKYDW